MTDNRTVNLNELSNLSDDAKKLILRIVTILATLDHDGKRRFLNELIAGMDAIPAQAGEVHP